MQEMMCASCGGAGKSTCFSCGGKRYSYRHGRYGLETNPCAPCGGQGRIRCQFCGGRGRVRNPGGGVAPQPVANQKPREGFDPNDLSGYWQGQNGGYELKKKKGDRYAVSEKGVAGVTAQGEAVREGKTLHLVVNNMMLGRLAMQLQIKGDTLRGQLNVMGMPMPIVLQRVSGPSAPAKKKREKKQKTVQVAKKVEDQGVPVARAVTDVDESVPVLPLSADTLPEELAARFTNRLEAATAAREAGAHEDAQRLYVQALETAMESPQPDDDLKALTGLLFLAKHMDLSAKTLERCLACIDGLIAGGHGGDAVAACLSLLVDSAAGRFDATEMRQMGEHAMTLLRGGLNPTNQALMAWVGGATWLDLNEPELARKTLDLVDRAAVPAEMEALLAKLDQALADAEG